MADVVEALNADERAVVLEVATRLRAGRKAYGALELERERRDFYGEAGFELVDAVAYLAMESIRRRKQS